jgi:two-component system, OmpR family, sensor kinase
MSMPIRTRLTLVSAGMVAIVLAVAGAFVYLRLQADLARAVDDGLRSRADALLATGGVPVGPTAPNLIESDEAFAQLIGPNGAVLASSDGIGDRPLVTYDELALSAEPFAQTEVRTSEGELIPARILVVDAGRGRTLLVGASLDERDEALARLLAAMTIGGPIALAIVVGVIWVVVGAALRPVEAMRAEAAAISASEPGRRLPVPHTGDELARLGQTLNAMLARLEDAIERERRFVDDASHELRTPLSNLKAEIDLALRRSRSEEELQRALASASEETDRLSRLAEDLLVLARADRGRLPVRRERVEVGTVVGSAVAPFTARAAERDVAIEVAVDDGLVADLDPVRIGQALGNLVDNAVQQTPTGGAVTVRASRQNGALRLEVRDAGPGFPEAFLPTAFEPFARPDLGRSRPEGGTGLGLAIVKAVVEAHGGRAEASNLDGGGAVVVLTIPERVPP